MGAALKRKLPKTKRVHEQRTPQAVVVIQNKRNKADSI